MRVKRQTMDGVEYLVAYVYSEVMYKYPMEYDVTYTLESVDPDNRYITLKLLEMAAKFYIIQYWKIQLYFFC